MRRAGFRLDSAWPDFAERFTGGVENRFDTCGFVIPQEGDIDIGRIEFNPAASSLSMLSRNQSRARTQKCVDYDLSAVGKIEDGVAEEAYGLWRWMVGTGFPRL